MRTTLRAAACAAALILASVASPAAADGWTVDDTYAAIDQHSTLAACIVRVETGGTYEPYSVGAQGELGVAQLHPHGLLPDFYARGYTDPYSPYQAMDYLDWALARGMGRNWSSYWYCT